MSDMDMPGVKGFSVRSDRASVREGSVEERFLEVRLEAAPCETRAEREPVRISFALDHSGSMAGRKMELARSAVRAALGRLRPEDRFAITAFASRVSTLTESVNATPTAIASAQEQLAELEAHGSTALHGGWERACEELVPGAGARRLGRCLLITDGEANVGRRVPEDLAAEAGRMRRRGVATSALGIGAQFNEELLAAMAREGGGQFMHVPSVAALAEALTQEIGDAQEVVATGVVIELWPSEGVKLTVLSDFPMRWAETHWRLEVGDLVGEQLMDVMLQVRVPRGVVGGEASVEVRLSDAEGLLELPIQRMCWSVVDARTDATQARDMEVVRRVAEMLVAAERLRNVRRNRSGGFEAIQEGLATLAERLRRLGGDDPEVARIIARMLREGETLGQHLDEMSLKSMHMASTSTTRGRDVTGRARKRAMLDGEEGSGGA